MADKVMRMPMNDQPFFSPKPISVSHVQRKCAHCEEEEKLQRKENTSQPTEASNETSSYINSLASKGLPLPESTRSFFEPKFGYDFSDIKIHNDSEAAKSADRINALAYTTGNNIVFNQNQFSPGSDSGKKLIAHELTHVVQQQSSDSILRKPIKFVEGDAVDAQSKRAISEVGDFIAPDKIVSITSDTYSKPESYQKDKIVTSTFLILVEHKNATGYFYTLVVERTVLFSISDKVIALGEF